jgi:acetylornithine/N-succinyldiaminopimelate aminotransferase
MLFENQVLASTELAIKSESAILNEGGRIHMDHYGGNRLPFALLSAHGIEQQFVRLNDTRNPENLTVLDGSGGYASACLGAGHPVILQALASQQPHVGYATDELGSLERARFLCAYFGADGIWADRFPASRYHVSGRSSGSEGMELAIRLVLENNWDYGKLAPRKGQENRRKILAFEGAWHGWTPGVQSLLNRRHYRLGLPDALLEGQQAIHTHFLPFGEKDLLNEFFTCHGDRLAAVFVEPIQGDAGILLPPPGYLRKLAQLCHRHGALLIADEVLTFAKTGQFFAMNDDDGIIPTDITVVGKGLGLGVTPVSLVIARRELTIRPTGAVSTCDLRPLACSLMHAGMNYVIQEGLLEHARILGADLREQLQEVVSEFPHLFTEVRGQGFLNGIELTERSANQLSRLRKLLIENGVYTEFMAGAGRRSHGLRYVFPALRLTPPLIANSADLGQIVRSIRLAARQLRDQR